MYEELDAAPRNAIAGLVRFLGYDELPPSSLSESLHQRQADEVTEAWVRRYERERQE